MRDTVERLNRSHENGPDEPNIVVANSFELVGKYGTYSLYARKTPEQSPPG
ncbi:MAG: hypothetical protein ACJ8KU_02775 [Chthoniobacterales bacterium]